jgi:hypothetical protein
MSNLVQEERFALIIDAVSYWLGYQYKIGRSQLIHEASLRYPIADAITAKQTAIADVGLEEPHPYFKKRSIDLVIYDVNSQSIGSNKDLSEVYEFKLAKLGTSKKTNEEHQRVFNDVLRLAYHHKWANKDCYFLMCGAYDDFKAYFVGHANAPNQVNGKNQVAARVSSQSFFQKWEPQGLYKDWFDFTVGKEKEITFQKDDIRLENFKDDYTIKDITGKKHEDEISIKTICKAITANGLENRTHAAGIWKIESI